MSQSRTSCNIADKIAEGYQFETMLVAPWSVAETPENGHGGFPFFKWREGESESQEEYYKSYKADLELMGEHLVGATEYCASEKERVCDSILAVFIASAAIHKRCFGRCIC